MKQEEEKHVQERHKDYDDLKIVKNILNTDISLPYDNVSTFIHYDEDNDDVPTSWDWSSVNGVTGEDNLRKQSMLMRSNGQQYMCGSCWAYAVTYALSDTLVISGVVDNADDARTYVTHVMAAFKNRGYDCSGGSVYVVLKSMLLNRMPFPAGGRCDDYSWCYRNPTCVNGYNHFDTMDDETVRDMMNATIPDKITCTDSKTYVLKTLNVLGQGSELSSESVFRTMKKNIMKHGSVVANVVLYRNFLKGHFARMTFNEGVYVESVDYDAMMRTGVVRKMDVSKQKIIGTHSFVVIGWGSALLDDGSGNVRPGGYWVCRNWWGDTWGNNGYCRIASYPINVKTFIGGTTLGVYGSSVVRIGGAFLLGVERTAPDNAVYVYPATMVVNTPDWMKILFFALLVGAVVLLVSRAARRDSRRAPRTKAWYRRRALSRTSRA